MTADYQHVVTVNLSDIYYWPITAEWRADFGGFNRRLQGTLRVLQDDRVVQTLEQRRFIYVYPHGPAGEATRILSGGEEGIHQDLAGRGLLRVRVVVQSFCHHMGAGDHEVGGNPIAEAGIAPLRPADADHAVAQGREFGAFGDP